MALTYDPIFAADPNNAANVAANASITIFDPNDPGKAPVTITDVTGSPLPNPITVNKNGFGPAFQHATLDRVGWFGAGFTGYFTSYEGMKLVATDAAAAAQAAAATAGADAAVVAEAAVASVIADADAAAASAATAATNAAASATNASASATAAANSAALVNAPADTAVQTLITNPGSATATALSATYATLDGSGKQPVRKGELIINALDYGAVNDGSADAMAGIIAAFTALGSAPGKVYLPRGTYLFDNPGYINIKAQQGLLGAGGGTKLIVRNSSIYGAIRTTSATTTNLTTVTSDATIGATSLVVASTAGVTVGQHLIVYSSVPFSPSSNTTRGEIVVVQAIPDSTHITIAGTLRDTYLVADSAGIRNPNLQRDISLGHFRIEAEDSPNWKNPLVQVQNLLDFKYEHVSFRNSAGPGLVLDTCVDSEGSGVHVANLQDDEANGKFGYGINIANCSDGILIDGIIGDNVRHMVTTTGAPGGTVAGVPRNVHVTNFLVKNCPTTAGIDTHAEGSNIKFSSGQVVNCAIGAQLRSRNTTIETTTIDNCGIGVLVTRGAWNAKILPGVVITNTRSYGGVYERGNAIVLRGIDSPTDILIHNVIVDGCDQAPVKITRPDTGATGADPVNVRIIDLRAFDGGKATTGRGVLWVEDQVAINSILMTGTIAANRTAAGKLKYLAEKSGAGVVDGVFVDNTMTGMLQKVTDFLGFSPTNVANNRHTDAVRPPSVGRGIRKGSNLFYGPEGSAGTLTPSANQLCLAPIDIDRVCTLNALAGEVTTAGSAGALLRLGIYADDGTGWFPGALIADAGTMDATATGAVTLTLGTPVVLMPGRYWVGGASQGSPATAPVIRTVSPTGAVTMPLTTGAPSTVANTGAAQNGVTGALPANYTTAYGVTSAVPRVVAQLS